MPGVNCFDFFDDANSEQRNVGPELKLLADHFEKFGVVFDGKITVNTAKPVNHDHRGSDIWCCVQIVDTAFGVVFFAFDLPLNSISQIAHIYSSSPVALYSR